MPFVLYFDCHMHAFAILSNDAVMQIKQFITITITITTTTTTSTTGSTGFCDHYLFNLRIYIFVTVSIFVKRF